MTYNQIIKQYETGLITKEEANRSIDMMNMGSDCYTYRRIR